MPLNLDNLCLAYPRLLYFATLVAFQEAVAIQVAALVLSCILLATDSTLFEKKFFIPLIWFYRLCFVE